MSINLNRSFKLPTRFSSMDMGQIACAVDNISMHRLKICLAVNSKVREDHLSYQDVEDITEHTHKICDEELSGLIDYLTMYVPDVTTQALVAALYINNDFLPADIDDQHSENAAESDFGYLLEFLEAEHDKTTADYAEAMLGIRHRIPANKKTPLSDFRMAARINLVLFMKGVQDNSPNGNIKPYLNTLNTGILDQSYEAAQRLVNLSGGMDMLDMPLDQTLTDFLAEIEEAIEANMQNAMEQEIILSP